VTCLALRNALNLGQGMVCLGDPTTYTIRVDDQTYTFEWHRYGGPAALGKRGDPLTHQPQAFLKAASLWNQQGRRVDMDGVCVWEPERPPRMVHLVGRHHALVADGDTRTDEEIRADWLNRDASPKATRPKGARQ